MNGSWQPDPYSRHQLRWWDGTQWTPMVSDDGITRDESAPNHSSPLPPPQAAAPWPPLPSEVIQALAPTPTSAPKPKRTRLFAAIGVVVVVVAAVVVVIATRGGDGSTKDSETAEGKKYVAAMAASTDSSTFTGSEATCIAEGAIDIVGVKALQDAGVKPEDLASNGGGDLLPGFAPNEKQANSIIDLMFTCVDFGKTFAEQMGSTGVSIPAEKLHCIGDQLEVNKTFRAYLLATMLSSNTTSTEPSSGDDSQAMMLEIFTKCGVSLTDLSG
jgi:hypothetical protein